MTDEKGKGPPQAKKFFLGGSILFLEVLKQNKNPTSTKTITKDNAVPGQA